VKWPWQRELAQSKRIRELLAAHLALPLGERWPQHVPPGALAALLADLPQGQPLQDETLELLEGWLRPGGSEYCAIGEDWDAHAQFWRTLAQRFPDQPRLLGNYADTLLMMGQIDQALEAFLTAFERDHSLISGYGGNHLELLKARGGQFWLRYRLVELEAALVSADADEDYARDLLRDILEEHRDNAAAVAEIEAKARAARPK